MVTVAVAVVIWWFARERMIEARKKREAIELMLASHITLCNEKAMSHTRLEGKVERIEEKMDDMKETMTARSKKIDAMDEKIDRLAEVLVAKRTI